MIVCHSRKFILFSNPKTGSESLRKLFAPWSEETIMPYRETSAASPFYPHMSPSEAAAVFQDRGWDFDRYLRITVVRNPFDRLVSLYRMITEVDRLWRTRRAFGLGQPSFPSWLLSTSPHGRGGGGRRHQRWRRFGTWSAEHWCAGKVDFVLRLEHLEQDLAPVLSGLNLAPGELPRLNQRPGTDLAAYYDRGTESLVRNRYAYDLERFGYGSPLGHNLAV